MALKQSLIALGLAGMMAVPGFAAELKVGYSADALTLDPANHRNRETETIIRNMFDGLVTRDAQMNVVAELAEDWTAIDATTYEFKLRQGVTFHDGSPFTAADVKFSLDRITKENAMGGQTSPRQSLLSELADVEVVDDHTVRLKLANPWPILPAMLPFQELVSEAHVAAVGEGAMADAVNGTGPFKLVEWRKGQSVIMERYDGYYGGASDIAPVGPACVERVIFQVIPENASRVAALLAGEVHIIDKLPAHMVSQVDANPDTKVMAVNGTRTSYIALNNMEGPFADIRVRKALAHAIDRQLVVDKILGGAATLTNGILSPDAFGKNQNLPAYEYDPEKAKALLAEAGYADGLEVTLDVDGANKEIAEALSAVAAAGGFRINVVVGEASMLSSRFRTKGEPIDGQMWLTSWGNGSLDPVGIFVPTHRTADRGNSSGYSNPDVDALLDEANAETDRARRAELYSQAEAIVNQDLPKVYLWVAQDLYGVSTKVTGWQPSADGRINLHDACLSE
ncbi:ABC transporter substrate-binding protein [Ovoidimarina sediminis]|uniref:ABC transporter substrate-binding protein n=1 Tax=Ovoidimarina sediminis TaxID=3079856 RepID=UPI00290A9F9D|nr:ABC transporter substrate-binding protein [Rhodophyticola sp. MJ-SS7]MDU8941814.1 ABC transporter substrate-binding protein [Rhodophyticola sp. MJ-SS7]